MLGGPEHPWRWPLIIIFWQGVYTCVTCVIAWLAHASYIFHAAYLATVLVIAVHNGANFYFERFAELYMKTFESAIAQKSAEIGEKLPKNDQKMPENDEKWAKTAENGSEMPKNGPEMPKNGGNGQKSTKNGQKSKK
eukprot:TRINITY_DN5468_c0_g1_i1.p1 TRINITY_DN5468_c0_g1~~TRINITY_DN5468_c0_g1_i1.p1  ORF type:complete len:137 (+),score=8.47 TRINITY_DN5468_c0_g1_i1:344-754(+)